MKSLLAFFLVVVLIVGCKSSTAPNNSTPTTSRILGTVKDSITNAPIAGAIIELYNMDTVRVAHTASDGSGSYWLDTVSAGTYYLVFSASNYDGFFEIIHVAAGIDVPVNIKLSPSTHHSNSTGVDFHIVSGVTGLPLSTATIEGVAVDANGNNEVFGSVGAQSFVIAAPGYNSQTLNLNFVSGEMLRDTVALFPHADTLLSKITFNGSGIDSSGNGNNGTLHGGTFVNDRFGNSRAALKLNGTSDYISIADAPSLNFGKSKSFSLCIWVKCQEQLNGSIILFRKGLSGAASTGYQVINEYYDFDASLGTTYGGVTGPSDVIGQDGLWHLLVYCFDRSGTISCYLDGNLCDASTHSSPATAMQGNLDNTAPLLIGGEGKASGSFAATIDDIRIYEGVLTQEETMAMFHENGW